jgi:hypothetical protein
MGIFFHAFATIFRSFPPIEFWTSAKYYAGTYSPVYKERIQPLFLADLPASHPAESPSLGILDRFLQWPDL